MRIPVDYETPLEQQLKEEDRRRKLFCISNGITAVNFPPPRSGVVEVKLEVAEIASIGIGQGFIRLVYSGILKEIKHLGRTPSDLYALLAYYKRCLDDYSIVGTWNMSIAIGALASLRKNESGAEFPQLIPVVAWNNCLNAYTLKLEEYSWMINGWFMTGVLVEV